MLSVGIAIGYVSCYITCCRPVWLAYLDANKYILTMRKQGFVPQFDLQQRNELDPAKEIREY